MSIRAPQAELGQSARGLELQSGSQPAGMIRQHPVVAYFAITFGISWIAALCVALPWLLRGRGLPNLAGILMFPAMLLGPGITGLVMTRAVSGPAGLGALGSRLREWRLGRWYWVLVIPPILVCGILLSLQVLVSPKFAPNVFLVGVWFGVPAGYLEEIGWMGFAFERLRARGTALSAAVVLGVMWAAWHLPVVDFLGTAHPHGSFWLPFFLAFGTAMTAMRVLISWVYVNTGSLLAAQLLHMSSTGALVVFGATGIEVWQEVTWYGLYALALWLVIAVIVKANGPALARREAAVD
jgi:membrane protease YdiL (CAAX protease family)